MDKLGLVDQLFFKADQYAVASMIMGGALILAPATARGKLDAEIIADHIAARLENVPVMRMKFLQDPLRIGSVRKVEDPNFDVHSHIQLGSIPEPGGYGELTAALAAITSSPLGANELWRWTLLDGLEGGRLALVCQLHHALFDGLGAMQALSSMYDEKPVKPEKAGGRRQQAPEEPGPYAMLADAIVESTGRLWRKTPRFVLDNAVPLVSSLAQGMTGMIGQGRESLSLPELNSTSHNLTRSSGKRSVAYKTMSLPEIKKMASQLHCTVNDIALLLYSFAMEHYFQETGEEIDFDLYCGMPISTRTDGASAGNQVTAARINLHNTIEDPVERLQAIHEDTVGSKKRNKREAQPIDAGALGELVSPLLLDGLMMLFKRLDLVGRMGGSVPVFNTVLSNVPGPREKTYIANGVLLESIPLIPAVEVLAVSGGITSVGDNITLGFHCDGEAVENPGYFVTGVESGLRALRKATGTAGKGRRKARKKHSA